jgi:hypothetical protein
VDGNFHTRDVGGPNDIWAIPTGEKVVVEFNTTYVAAHDNNRDEIPKTSSELSMSRVENLWG